MSKLSTVASKLKSRGVGKRYYDLSLASYEHALSTKVLEWFDNESEAANEAGRGLAILGQTLESYDIAILAARALILKYPAKLRCVSFLTAMSDECIAHIYDEHPPLMIMNFRPSQVDVERYKRLEDCLDYYLDHKIPVHLHIPLAETTESFGDLVNPVFQDRIRKINKVFLVN